MDFDLNDEQRELRDTARRFLEREAPIGYARAMIDDPAGYREDVWKRMAELGWMALALPEEHEGLGIGFIAQTIVLIEMGRVVLPGPYLPTVLAASAIAEHGSDEQRKELLPRIARGGLVAAIALDDGVHERDGALHGIARFVPAGADAGVLVVAARSGDERSLFLVERPPSETVGWMDATRRAAELTFDATPAERLGTADASTVERTRERAATALAAEMLGAAERVLELSVHYAKERVQFGRAIGSFQAVKHRLADMLVDVESIRNAVYYASWAHERDHPDAPLAASMAKACAGDAAVRVAKSGIQVHGGIGFTWEHDMHLFFKRIKACDVWLGDATEHRERLAGLLRTRA